MAKTSFHVCYHCKDRHIGCHSSCKPYLEEKEENEKIRIKKNQDSFNQATINICKDNRLKSRCNRGKRIYRTHKK